MGWAIGRFAPSSPPVFEPVNHGAEILGNAWEIREYVVGKGNLEPLIGIEEYRWLRDILRDGATAINVATPQTHGIRAGMGR
jgi:hypothetical protein